MIKKILPDLIAILAFVLISFAYFFPADIEGRILFQHDTAAGAGAGQEAKEYYEQTGERTRWTNSLFGGMPTYQISPSYDSTVPLQWTQKIYQLFLPTYVNLTFILMLGFYILLRAFGIPAWLAGLGGIMWAFSSYFFILISAGHIWKFIPDKNKLVTQELWIEKGKTPRNLHFWDVEKEYFIPVSCDSITSDTTQLYTRIPDNALLWYATSHRALGQRVGFIENGQLKRTWDF